MLSDRAPFEYIYLTRRLLTELVKHDEALRPRGRRAWSMSLFGLTFTAERRRPDYANLHELAERSLDLVGDHSGGLDCGWCPYVHAELDLYRGVFSPHMGWMGGEVACFRGEVTGPEGESVFLAMFGSANNLSGYRTPTDEARGFYPSDMAGLYALLDAVREPGDEEIDLQYRLDDQALERATIIEEAMEFAAGGATAGPVRLSMLARQLIHHERYSGHMGNYDRVVVAAPLWVATPRPAPSPDGSPPLRR